MKIIEVQHPLVQHKMGLMRRKDISNKEFRELVAEVGTLVAFEATRDLETEDAVIEGWAGPTHVRRLAGKVTLVPILRAGLGMLQGVLAALPTARIGVVGLKRNESTLRPDRYYLNLPARMAERVAIIVDPMLATGGSTIAAIDQLKAQGCTRIKGVFLVSAPEGLRAVEAAHPDFEVYTAAIDDRLNEMGYILPGLGDAGDKLFGTDLI
ncbi:hypothetical protein N800_10310 [Lysobacter daejeonensis GH1-9]|uniref:Uracil phosphoribosyltransferase n=1 Tax=Lysobacter daejeonensis GH1-9 TaxID=1385517 RepID=A0A0A0EZN8_9GAMM|nr:uracil phosphoribosyltransferase [Lysobacter daejeonensis]KGM56009.1 hypothetical protein N800_10310 [Lysobacter daejeonensis GH1-9]